MSAPVVVSDPDCYLCCPEPCCDHSGRDEHGCWDCRNTGHAHAQCQPCPNCTDSPGDGVGHVPGDDVACSVCGFDIEEAVKQEAASDNRLFQTGF